jgi:hypothetical protein
MSERAGRLIEFGKHHVWTRSLDSDAFLRNEPNVVIKDDSIMGNTRNSRVETRWRSRRDVGKWTIGEPASIQYAVRIGSLAVSTATRNRDERTQFSDWRCISFKRWERSHGHAAFGSFLAVDGGPVMRVCRRQVPACVELALSRFGDWRSLMKLLDPGPFKRRSVPTHFSECHNSLLKLEIGNGRLLKPCQLVPNSATLHCKGSRPDAGPSRS